MVKKIKVIVGVGTESFKKCMQKFCRIVKS